MSGVASNNRGHDEGRRPDTGLLSLLFVLALYVVHYPLGILANLGWLVARPRVLKAAALLAGVGIGLATTGGLLRPSIVVLTINPPNGVAAINTKTISMAVVEYAIDHDGRYPASLEELYIEDERGQSYLKGGTVPNDPWGRPYRYREPSFGVPLRVWTYGADGQPGGIGEDTDVDQDHEAVALECRRRMSYFSLFGGACSTRR